MNTGFPRQENLSDLVGDAAYVEDGIRWRVFVDLDGLDPRGGALPGRNVLVILGDRWTAISGQDFRELATRVLAQL